ncbi:eukaryotic translation initiation factor 2A [Histoplasma capsulatum var. duboisii H88]|uniref:Eukaryotic translation initiation factor 2A n=2 Tax=Ajellomyces capsulatus TaxID=5037 RepID=F0UQD1_AJEC8|nr:eukaryotic translation initiation factor 2A [Histoplasma capsulatum H143]EGC47921.1 eukaryotic translation initiation factor 2A [Histoplasma capsulatum var. duboisii H88]QSS54075.1 eukaryotic translation initiation factor 2A [Histoplasma capsulatum var. duboisii H88]
MAAPNQYAYRTQKGISIVDAAPVYESLPGFTRPDGNLRCCTYSPCGRYFAWAAPERVVIVDPSVGHVVTTLPSDNVYELGFSPLGTYIITWQRPSKDENGDAVKNLKVWRVIESYHGDEGNEQEHSFVGSYVQKSQTGWNLQYTADEKYCARVVTNEVQFYESGNLGKVWNKLRVEGVADFALSPGDSNSIAVFIPERKGLPASVRIFNVPQFNTPVSQKNFFKGDKVQLKWNNTGTTLIVLAQTDVDKTGKSYYGETTLYLLSANSGFDSRIDLDKEGPIHDVTWSPNSKEFGVVYGYMPAKTTIFNNRAVATHSFALAPRNTILFSPNGRFVIVAGFGNLAGQLDIYDLDRDYTKVATIEASNASVCEWSPDGKFILTATTSPRLRVDNGVRIWHVGGGLMYNEDLTELYQVCWRPQSTTVHPPENPFHPMPSPHPSALEYLATKKAPSKPAGAYRPPGARGQTTPLAFRREDEGGEKFIRDESSSSIHGTSLNGFGKNRRRVVPGAEPVTEYLPPGAAPGGGVTLPPGAEGDEKLSRSAAKNKKKREAKKAKEMAEKAGNLAADAGIDSTIPTGPSADRRERRAHSRSRSRGNNVNSPALDPNSFGRPNRDRSRSTHHRHRSDHQNRTNGGPPTGQNRPSVNTRTSQPNGTAAAAAVPSPPDVRVTSPTTPSGGAIQDKKIRGLLKKIRAIEELKLRVAGGEKLEDTQMKKIQTEDGVRKELEALGWSG